MNRGQLEEIGVRLYMVVIRNRIQKSAKAEAQKRIKIEIRQYSDWGLYEFIIYQVGRLELM